MSLPGEELLPLLENGEMEVLGMLPRASNYTFLARITGGGGEAMAVYKPTAGEAPLWDFPDGTLAMREVAAFRVARALGWPWVPPTLLRDGPGGHGSAQLFVEFDPTQHYFTLLEERDVDFRDVALFDVVVNNADRKAGHCLLSTDDRLFVVDHGVCFNRVPKLRTVIWEYAGEEIPERLAADLRGLQGELADGALQDELAGLLDPDEVEAMRARLDRLLTRGRFPEPSPRDRYPWPPV